MGGECALLLSQRDGGPGALRIRIRGSDWFGGFFENGRLRVFLGGSGQQWNVKQRQIPDRDGTVVVFDVVNFSPVRIGSLDTLLVAGG